jgi:hypothetical protein
MSKYIEITKEIAEDEYCYGRKIYICNAKRQYWKLPSSYEYGSSAPASQLFYRGIPHGEGENKFYVVE